MMGTKSLYQENTKQSNLNYDSTNEKSTKKRCDIFPISNPFNTYSSTKNDHSHSNFPTKSYSSFTKKDNYSNKAHEIAQLTGSKMIEIPSANEINMKPFVCRKLDFDEDIEMCNDNYQLPMTSPEALASFFPNNNLSQTKVKTQSHYQQYIGLFDPIEETQVDDEHMPEDKFDIIRRTSSFVLMSPKFDDEYIIMKTLSKAELGTVYLCINSNDKQVYAVKQTKEFSSRKDYQNIIDLVTQFKTNIYHPLARFSSSYIDYWIEAEQSIYHREKNLYIVSNYYSNGDLANYLQRLRKYAFTFTKEFVWDLIFEMICGVLFIHQIGYAHLDIKPANFLVNEEGEIKIGDFCLSCKEETMTADTIFEGDSVYLSPELFNRTIKDKSMWHKSDVFSLGLSLVEIIYKITLPKNGDIWREIRSEGFSLLNFLEKFYNINEAMVFSQEEHDRYLVLIERMICFDINQRADLNELIKDFPELFERYKALDEGRYQRFFNPLNWEEFSNETKIDMNANMISKRSDSCKFIS